MTWCVKNHPLAIVLEQYGVQGLIQYYINQINAVGWVKSNQNQKPNPPQTQLLVKSLKTHTRPEPNRHTTKPTPLRSRPGWVAHFNSLCDNTYLHNYKPKVLSFNRDPLTQNSKSMIAKYLLLDIIIISLAMLRWVSSCWCDSPSRNSISWNLKVLRHNKIWKWVGEND